GSAMARYGTEPNNAASRRQEGYTAKGHLRRALPVLASLPLAFLASGCVYALQLASHPTDVKLRVQASQPQRHRVRVALDPPSDSALRRMAECSLLFLNSATVVTCMFSESSRCAMDLRRKFALWSCGGKPGLFAGFPSRRSRNCRRTRRGSALSRLETKIMLIP